MRGISWIAAKTGQLLKKDLAPWSMEGEEDSTPTSLILCLENMMLLVVWTHGMNVINIGLLLGLVVLASGLNAH
jgi:hypothetical protein